MSEIFNAMKSAIVGQIGRPRDPVQGDLTALIVYVEKDRARAAVNVMKAAYVNRTKMHRNISDDPAIRMIPVGDHVIAILPPETCAQPFVGELSKKACLYAQSEIADLCEASFVVNFGDSPDVGCIGVLHMTGDAAEHRPALALSLTSWRDGHPEVLKGVSQFGTRQAPMGGLTCGTAGDTVLLHQVGVDPYEATATMRDSLVDEISSDHAPIRPLSDRPATCMVLNLADGMAWDMSGGTSVPFNKVGKNALRQTATEPVTEKPKLRLAVDNTVDDENSGPRFG